MRPGTRKVIFGGQLGPEGRHTSLTVRGCNVELTPNQCRVIAPPLYSLTAAAELSSVTIGGLAYEIAGAPVITDDTVTVTGHREE